MKNPDTTAVSQSSRGCRGAQAVFTILRSLAACTASSRVPYRPATRYSGLMANCSSTSFEISVGTWKTRVSRVPSKLFVTRRNRCPPMSAICPRVQCGARRAEACSDPDGWRPQSKSHPATACSGPNAGRARPARIHRATGFRSRCNGCRDCPAPNNLRRGLRGRR